MKLLTPLLAAVLLGAPAGAAPADPGFARVGDLPKPVADRFLSAAAFVETADGTRTIFYDFATRCALVVPAGKAGTSTQTLVAASGPRARVNAPYVARQAWGDLSRLSAAPPGGAGDCEGRIAAAYGDGFQADAQKLGAISRHAVSLLATRTLIPADAKLDERTRKITEQSRKRLQPAVRNPVLLSAIRSDQMTVLVIGEPLSPRRLLAQYRNLPNGSWQFEGAYDAGIL